MAPADLLENASDITYFDPDIRIYDALNDISALAREHDIVLIPHVLEPMPRDDRVPSETTILRPGSTTSASSRSQMRLKHSSNGGRKGSRGTVASHRPRARFVDQRWVDFVPGMFNHYILRDPAADVAHWNLWSRRLDGPGNVSSSKSDRCGSTTSAGSIRSVHIC